MPGPSRFRVEVDLAAVRHNVERLVEVAAGATVMAVVKADGYGHGMVPCARAAVAGGAGALGVAFVEEALALRDAGLDVPVLAWLLAPGDDVAAALARDVQLSASAPWALEEIAAAARAVGRPARVHLDVDTGLSRAGATPRDWPDLLDRAARLRAEGVVEIAALWSHLAYADAPGHPTIDRQRQVFLDAVEVARAHGIDPPVRHLANSAATLTRPDARFELVRPGVAVYGLSPGPEVGSAASLGLRPAMTLRARVALAKRVPPGSGVSYGHRYTTARETTLALVPLGYADGVPRHATNVGPVQVAGRRYTVSGTVCMDQFVVDVGDAEVAAGDEVVLFGAGDRGEPTADDWAAAVGTINYEIVTRIGGRVPRCYLPDPAHPETP